ncbi:hypothetical protein TSAR_014859 [Trichomalopsis sarcophagae]|uniref:Uncharacterized protein n=1 Tax=Trichomalopsis sarcophagae TaxID=543379 RepID=A0A232EWA0_9HYME|nr:hypothetical protein TSAR_014859 [Trichomalopsis sarcophagae]
MLSLCGLASPRSPRCYSSRPSRCRPTQYLSQPINSSNSSRYSDNSSPIDAMNFDVSHNINIKMNED